MMGGRAPQIWEKLGVVVAPQPDVSWMSHYAGPTFVESFGDRVRLYVTGRDADNQSRIGMVDGRLEGRAFEIAEIHAEPVLGLGEVGMFDESGASYPWLVRHGGQVFMYYVGWTAGTRTRFRNFLGLAVSDDGGETFNRRTRVPILDRTDEEPYGSGSCAVWVDESGWRMLYTAFEPWWEGSDRQSPSYRIKEALSTDGVVWQRDQRVIIGFEHPDEYVIGKPMVLFDDDVTRLWYCYRGESYRIGYAESVDGQSFVRRDDLIGIEVSETGWDSEMVEYAFVFDHGGERYMVYNGNQFGQTGLGLAIAS